MDYADWITAVTTLGQIADPNGIAAFSALAPRCIEFAENLIYRDGDLDFPELRVVDVSQKTIAGVRSVPIPPSVIVSGFAGTFRIVEGVTLILPANLNPSLIAEKGTRLPLLRVSRPFLDQVWPTEGQMQTPVQYETYYALYSQENPGNITDPTEPTTPLPSAILIGPTVDDVYPVEFTGVGFPVPLSEDNPVTFLTTYLPDLFVAASMWWFIGGYQRDFGAGANNPGLAQFWQGIYGTLKGGAATEAARQAMRGGTTMPMPAGGLARGIMPPGAPGR